MARFSRLVLVVPVLLVFGAHIGQSLRASFYNDYNYKGFLEDVVVSGEKEKECIDLKYSDTGPFRSLWSVKTDKCLIMYRNKGCESVEPPFGMYVAPESIRIEGDTPRIPDMNMFNSLHVCSQKLGGGPQLDLDVFGGTILFGYKLKYEHEYRGVCGCRNFPSWVPNTPVGHRVFTMINNHGNSVNVYAGEDCQGQSKYLAAGQSEDSFKVTKFPFKVRSFKPAELTHCYRLNAKIHRFEFSNGTDSLDSLDAVKVQLATSADINNNGASEITQTYRVNSKVTSSVEFSVAESLSKVHSTGVEAGFEYTYETGVPVVSSHEFKVSVKANYQYTRTEGSDVRNTTTSTTEESIDVEQQIKIPPCKACTVTTYVKKVKGFVIKYKAYANVKAPEDAAPMTVDELRKNLPAGLDYVKTVDQHTIQAVTEGTMTADFGVKSIIDVDCVPIPTCGPTYYSVDDHQFYESPLDVLPATKYRSASEPGPGQTENRTTIFPFLKHTLGLLMKHLS